jgi:hypothetical protein
VRFSLPGSLLVPGDFGRGLRISMSIPLEQREQLAGGLVRRLVHAKLRTCLRQRLDELETSADPAVVLGAGLIRYATVRALVYDLLPDGRAVHYRAAPGDEIPTIPEDLPANEAADNLEGLMVPYVPAARRFYMPQWVALDENDRLLVSSETVAEAYLASMQQFVKILHIAAGLAPYILVDELYQRKRQGMLGQLINQGQALARYQTAEIITQIQQRAAAQTLNRGVSISLPYFDDQALEMKDRRVEIIPAGRVQFVPAFVTLAARREMVKVDQDTRLGRNTRKHLLSELRLLEATFRGAELKR